MRKFVALDCLVDSNVIGAFPNDVVQHFRRSLLAPVASKPNIQQVLQQIDFKFHRTCSFPDLIRECNVAEGQTLLMFWGQDCTESKATMSVTASSCSFLQPILPQSRDKGLRSTSQQTDISCRVSSGLTSPVSLTEAEEAQLRARLADSLPFASGPPGGGGGGGAGIERSMSILGSVCALLLNKGGAASGKRSGAASPPADSICRICFGGESGERLVRPCACRGTIAAVHRSCLERWLLQAATSYCELCRYHYVVTRTHKWSWVRSVAEWARSGRGRALAADAWRAAALGALSVAGTARALAACDRVLQAAARRGGGAALAANLFSSLLIGVIGALNGLLTTWMLLKVQEHQAAWRAWRDATLHVRVCLPPPSGGGGGGGGSDRTVVAGGGGGGAGRPTSDRATDVADPFMVALPHPLADP